MVARCWGGCTLLWDTVLVGTLLGARYWGHVVRGTVLRVYGIVGQGISGTLLEVRCKRYSIKGVRYCGTGY